VFDYIVFRVDGGTVYLAGFSFEGRLRADAEMAVKRASGGVEVANKIEVLPSSQNDDRIRWRLSIGSTPMTSCRDTPLVVCTTYCES
jgi:hypothetical protein